jgi:hypothetical protein
MREAKWLKLKEIFQGDKISLFNEETNFSKDVILSQYDNFPSLLMPVLSAISEKHALI